MWSVFAILIILPPLSGAAFSFPGPQEGAARRRAVLRLVGRPRQDQIPLPGGHPGVVPRGPALHAEEPVHETQLRVAAVL